ncbi:hypothetical protein IE53DRAFT_390014 [Violaceomyces palustris]|uniref:Uncharacterized protein n=1 Tax=Violaceomyces palustris TaxID=1673888 RepID=A0ACD0NQ04_9BASI|nr:hypothetical protein IE53DRAFT_390014 [Violaceomyces palustris]
MASSGEPIPPSLPSSSVKPSPLRQPHRLLTQKLDSRLELFLSVQGQPFLVASSLSPTLLSETKYPARYYLPKHSIQAPFTIVPSSSSKVTYCPFKGFASYHDLVFRPSDQEGGGGAQESVVFRDLFWSYEDPFIESHAADLRGLICLDVYSQPERYDLRIKLDGETLSLDSANKISNEMLAASQDQSASPSQARPGANQSTSGHEEPQSNRLATPQKNRHPSHLQRGGSPDPPRSVQHYAGDAAAMEPDSSDPVIADLIYRYEDRREEAKYQSRQRKRRQTIDSDSARIHTAPGERPSAAASAAAAGGQPPASPVVEDELAWIKGLPWYKRPSEKWLRPFALILAIAGGMAMSPKVELLTALVCEEVFGVEEPSLVAPSPLPPSSPDQPNDGLEISLFPPYSQANWEQTVPVGSRFEPSHLENRPDHQFGSSWIYNVLSLPEARVASADSVPTNTTDFPQAPAPPSTHCRTSPRVQTALASLQLKLTLSMGVLAALTTGFWSGLSARLGRLTVLRIAITGMIVTDVTLLTVALVPRSSLPGGTHFLLVGTTFEGLLGGYSTIVALHQSYISDVTPSGTRAHIFAFFMGILYSGIMIGPSLGGHIVKATGYILAPFWIALAVHIIYVLCVTIIIPESTSRESRAKAAEEHLEKVNKMREARKSRSADREEEEEDGQRPLLDGGYGRNKVKLTKRMIRAFKGSVLYMPLEPLSILLPRKVEEAEVASVEWSRGTAADRRSFAFVPPSHRNSMVSLAATEASSSHISVSHIGRRTRYDLNLTLLSLTYFFEAACMGILSSKVQYAQMRFDWGSAELGMYLSFAGLTRVVALLGILPVAIRFLHRDPATKEGEGGDWGEEDATEPEEEVEPIGGLRRRKLQKQQELGIPDERQGLLKARSEEELVVDVEEGRQQRRASIKVSDYGTLGRGHSRRSSGGGDSSYREGEGKEDVQEGEDEDQAWTQEEEKGVEELWTLRAKHLRLIHDSSFDLKLAKISILINAASYLILIFSNTPQLFLAATALTALGGGGGAAMSSLALALLKSPQQAGKLFGAWSIASAIASTILGPILFAEVFERTTAWFVQAIFVLGFALFVLSLLILSFVKVRRPTSLPVLPRKRPSSIVVVVEDGGRNDKGDDDDEEEGDDFKGKVPGTREGTWRSAFKMFSRKSQEEEGGFAEEEDQNKSKGKGKGKVEGGSGGGGVRPANPF